MSVVNAVVGSACGAVFLCDWLVARSGSPRAVLNAKRRAERRITTDEGYQPSAEDRPTPIQTTIQGMRKECFAQLCRTLLFVIPCTTSVYPPFSARHHAFLTSFICLGRSWSRHRSHRHALCGIPSFALTRRTELWLRHRRPHWIGITCILTTMGIVHGSSALGAHWQRSNGSFARSSLCGDAGYIRA